MLPLYFASGAGALGRHSVGTAIVGGMVLSTVLNLFFIPVLYVVVKSILVRFSSRPKSRPDGCDDDETALEQQQITINQ